MTMTEWLIRAFWTGMKKWIERDPAAAEERVANFFADVIERVIAAQEAQADSEGVQQLNEGA